MDLNSFIRYVMADLVTIAVTLTAGVGLLAGSILTVYYCYRRYHRNRLRTSQRLAKQRQDENYLHSVIINQHIARHLRPKSSISIISNNYHRDTTLMAPPRRFTILEEQQQQHQQQDQPATLVIENPLTTVESSVETNSPRTFTGYIYENPALELGELTTISSIRS